jgi:S-adenosylmethionine synthetase
MKIEVLSNNIGNIEEMPIELVERKGIGHPDTLADMIADEFSNRYSRFCLDKFGVIPHHWADKVTLVGAKSEIGYGTSKLLRPIKAFQFGRITPDIGDMHIDVDGIFKNSVQIVMKNVFPDAYLDGFIDCEAITHDGAGPDHPKEFYDPKSVKDVGKTQEKPKSNDTMIMTSYAGYSPIDIMCLEIENYLNSRNFKKKYPQTGYDVKVLASRFEHDVDVTVCVPFIGLKTPNFREYKDALAAIQIEVNQKLKEIYPKYKISLHFNTKDFGEYAYLTFFGTSLDKGGCGAVGRGNRFNGLITPTREMSVEAPSGKNPTHHSGRLYSEAAFRISKDIYLQCGVQNYLNIIARNGDNLDDPAFVFVKCSGDVSKQANQIRQIVKNSMDDIAGLTKEIVFYNPVDKHVERPRELYSAGRWLI